MGGLNLTDLKRLHEAFAAIPGAHPHAEEFMDGAKWLRVPAEYFAAVANAFPEICARLEAADAFAEHAAALEFEVRRDFRGDWADRFSALLEAWRQAVND